MEHVDDDFGDLYAEVEVQASSAINGVPGFSESQIENEENVGKEEGKAEVSEKVSIQEKEDSGSDSDDDDDLKIVLNSDEDEGLGFQISARDANPRSGLGLEDEYDDQDRDGGKVVGLEGQGENAEQSLTGGVGERGNGVKPGFHSQYSQYKYIRSQSTAYASNLKGNGCAAAASSFYSTGRSEWEDNGFGKRMGPSSLLPKGGHNFSLPRSRTILDVNIDIFEQKPWKNPGADITDYFNFGLNEDSWKIYCNQVDEYRHKAATSTKPLAPESFQLTEAYEVGGDDEMVTKEGIGERIHNRCMQPVPSMTSEMTKGRAIQVEDSIVERISSMDIVRPLVRDSDVIHITVQDSMEHSSGSVREGLENSIQKASPNGDVGLDEEGEFLCFSSASEDELQSESLDGNHEAMELSVPKRSKRITTDDPVPLNCEGDESHQICGVERHHWQEASASGSDGTNEAIEILNNTKERISEDTCTMDPSVLEAESSAGKRGYAGHCKAYKDCDYIDNGDSCSHTRRRSTKSATECRKSVKSDYYHLKDSNLSHLKRNPNDSRYHTRHRSSAHHINRSHSGSKLQAHFENECSFSRLDTEEIYDAHLSPVGHGGRNDVPHAFDYCHRENRSYYKESELSSDYYGERFSDYEIGGDCTRGLHKKGHWSSRKMDRHFFRDSDEEEYFHEQRRFFMKEELTVKDWCQYENESPREKYAPYSEDKRVSGWKRKEDGPHFRKSVKSGDFFLDYRHTDDIQQGKYRRSLTYAEREKDYVELQYGGHEAYAGRKVESPGRNQRRFGSPFDNYWSAGDEDDYLRYRDGKALTFRSFKEPCPTNNSRRRGNMMSVNHVYEKRGKCMRQWSKRIRNTVSFGSYSDVFDTEEDALSADMKFRRKHHWHAELQWNEDKIISRRRDGETHIEGTIYSLDNTPMHKSRHGFNHMVEPIDGHHVDGYGYRQIRKGNSFNKFDRTSNGIHRGSHEQPFLRYGETVDSQLVVGEPKSPHRYYDKHEKIGWSINEERAWRDFDASQPEKLTQAEPDFEAHEKDEEWLDKFPVPQTNEALDIEEGQIMAEELPSGPTENIYKSDTVAQSRNVKALPNGNGKTGGTVEEYEDSRILQVMAKMERRRERFKESITLSKEKEMDNAAKVTVDLENRTPVSNHLRPVRKRRWRDS